MYRVSPDDMWFARIALDASRWAPASQGAYLQLELTPIAIPCRWDLSQQEPTQGLCATGKGAMQPSQMPTWCLAASCRTFFPTSSAQTVNC